MIFIALICSIRVRGHVNSDMSVTSIALRQTANCFRTKAPGANFEKQFVQTVSYIQCICIPPSRGKQRTKFSVEV